MRLPDPHDLLHATWPGGADDWQVWTPGRVNLIGEHIDYHGLAVMPMALTRGFHVAFRARTDSVIRAVNGNGYAPREFAWSTKLEPSAAGDWVNYIKAAAQTVGDRWGIGVGVDAAVVSDLPPAAGLSSSTALLVSFTLGLLRANGIKASFEELMEVLPEGEHFVGTRGGGMDHAAVLGSKRGCASMIEFVPMSLTPAPMPEGWGVLVAFCMATAEKSSKVKDHYNSRRVAGTKALAKLGFDNYRNVLQRYDADEIHRLAGRLDEGLERDAFQHVTSEAGRVRTAYQAIPRGDAETFGRVLCESHASLRDVLRVSCGALDETVEIAMDCGARGARLTGAGFGGCVVILADTAEIPAIRNGLKSRFYAKHPGFDESLHLITAEPGAGALAPR